MEAKVPFWTISPSFFLFFKFLNFPLRTLEASFKLLLIVFLFLFSSNYFIIPLVLSSLNFGFFKSVLFNFESSLCIYSGYKCLSDMCLPFFFYIGCSNVQLVLYLIPHTALSPNKYSGHIWRCTIHEIFFYYYIYEVILLLSNV